MVRAGRGEVRGDCHLVVLSHTHIDTEEMQLAGTNTTQAKYNLYFRRRHYPIKFLLSRNRRKRYHSFASYLSHKHNDFVCYLYLRILYIPLLARDTLTRSFR